MKAYLIVGVASLTSFSAWASCSEPPAPPAPPSGAAATRAEMLTAQTAIKDYNAAVISFTECVRKGGNPGEIQRAGDVVEQLEKLAVRFNAELRAFKHKNGAQ
jgi:hypothetical protein